MLEGANRHARRPIRKLHPSFREKLITVVVPEALGGVEIHIYSERRVNRNFCRLHEGEEEMSQARSLAFDM